MTMVGCETIGVVVVGMGVEVVGIGVEAAVVVGIEVVVGVGWMGSCVITSITSSFAALIILTRLWWRTFAYWIRE